MLKLHLGAACPEIQFLDAFELVSAPRISSLVSENFMSMEQAMIILHQWSWTGEGFTRVLEKLQWEDGKRLPTLKALAFRN